MNLPFRPSLRRCRRWSSLGIIACGFLFCVFCPVVSGMDYYLKITGVPGEIASGGFTGWTRLTSLSANVLRPVPLLPTAPAIASTEVHFTKAPGAASAVLIGRCAEGLVTPRLVIVCMDGASPVLRITLSDVLISSFQSAADAGGGPPEDDIGCKFRSIEWSYAEQEGASGGTTATFNVVTQTGDLKPRVPFRATCEQDPLAPGGLRVTCPVEAGHSYRVVSTLRLSGPWQPIHVFTATSDGVMDVTVPRSGAVLFLRVEEVE